MCFLFGHTNNMSILSNYFHRKATENPPFHPRPDFFRTQRICADSLLRIFERCDDFQLRPVWPGGEKLEGVSVCWLDGVTSAEAVSRDVLRPLAEGRQAAPGADHRAWFSALERGAVWQCAVTRCGTLADLLPQLLGGSCAVVSDRLGEALAFETRGANTRAVGQPSVEKSVKGGKDAFVETLRTNTALVRRRLRSSALKLVQTTVGRKSGTPVAVMFLDGVASPETVSSLLARLDGIDIDGLTAAGNLEPYLTDFPNSPFPQLIHTERPDKFASELLSGRIGLLADGLPLGFLLPATLPHFMKVAEDKAQHFIIASALTLLRWLSMLISVLFPALLIAVSMYHQEMIPAKLLVSMIAAKQEVPFSSAVEVLAMLVAFELLMEAGIRLPDPVGDTVSIIGALIVGQSAVEARIVSPIAVIVVATSAICGFTQPSRDLGAALRLVRFAMVFLSTFFGLFGIAVGLALLIWYLCTLESFGVPYMAPLCEGGAREILRALLRPPVDRVKLRESALHTPDRRNQK